MSKSEKHTIHLPDGSRVEVTGDKYEIHLAKPIVVHRKQWIRWFSPADEVSRTILAIGVDKPIRSALEVAFKAVPQVVHSEDDDRPWHYDSQGYCDNPGRGY